MKVLHVAQYIYRKQYPEFQKNKSGLGIMVNDICSSTSDYDDIYLLTHAITKGHEAEYKIIKHSWLNVIKNARLSDIIKGFKAIKKARTSLWASLHLLYYSIDTGCLKDAIEKIKPDIIHIHEYTPAVQGYIDYCYENHLSYLVTCHGLLAEKECAEYIKLSEAHMMELYKKSNVVITTISTSIKDKLIKYYDIEDDSRISVVFNGVKAIDAKRKQKKSCNKVLICVGQLSERKNQEQIVRTISIMSNELKKKLKVYFIGNDTLGGKIQSLIKEKCLENVIQCIGFVEREQIREYYEIADGLIVASKDEGFGLPIVEAMSYGVPCVMFQDLDAAKDLSSPQTTTIVAKRDDENLCNAIETLLDTEWDCDTIRGFALQFTLDKMGNHYHIIYNSIYLRGRRLC